MLSFNLPNNNLDLTSLFYTANFIKASNTLIRQIFKADAGWKNSLRVGQSELLSRRQIDFSIEACAFYNLIGREWQTTEIK